MLCSDPANKTKHWFVLQRAHNGPSADMLFWKDVWERDIVRPPAPVQIAP